MCECVWGGQKVRDVCMCVCNSEGKTGCVCVYGDSLLVWASQKLQDFFLSFYIFIFSTL